MFPVVVWKFIQVIYSVIDHNICLLYIYLHTFCFYIATCQKGCGSGGVCTANNACKCNPGFGGSRCDQCEPGFWGPKCERKMRI